MKGVFKFPIFMTLMIAVVVFSPFWMFSPFVMNNANKYLPLVMNVVIYQPLLALNYVLLGILMVILGTIFIAMLIVFG